MTKSTHNLTDADGGSRIPQSVAQQLIETYKTEEGWADNKTRAVWFSAANFTDILALISENSGDGARIYFGKYPGNADIPGTPDPSDKGMVTLVFIPTLATASGGHQDLFPATPPVSVAVAARNGEDYQGYNHGDLCPPC
ncbi:MAG TPA: hypothetical protein VK563_14825 [Puia sp.]|nr:hypothetical protein [Puia sp.]